MQARRNKIHRNLFFIFSFSFFGLSNRSDFFLKIFVLVVFCFTILFQQFQKRMLIKSFHSSFSFLFFLPQTFLRISFFLLGFFSHFIDFGIIKYFYILFTISLSFDSCNFQKIKENII